MPYSVYLLNFNFHKYPTPYSCSTLIFTNALLHKGLKLQIFPNALLRIGFSWQIFANPLLGLDFSSHILTDAELRIDFEILSFDKCPTPYTCQTLIFRNTLLLIAAELSF